MTRSRLASVAAFLFILFLLCFSFYGCAQRNEKRYAEFKASGGEREIVRTPDERFENLPGYDFAPHYIEIDGLRVHYVDEGPRGSAPVLLLHGEPTWSYLYRKMIPPIASAGHRVIAPDLVGFGKSDKPVKRKDYSYQLQVDMVTAFIRELDLTDITLFCQDWGGLIGLRVAAENPDRFARIIAANTALPGRPRSDSSGSGPRLGIGSIKSGLAFLAWLTASQLAPVFHAGAFVQIGTVSDLAPEVVAAYNAPFPDSRYKAGARVYPTLVASQLEENNKAWDVLVKWEKPFLTAHSEGDPILGDADKTFQEIIPGAKGRPHVKIKAAGHFLQEDKGEELAGIVIEFIEMTRND